MATVTWDGSSSTDWNTGANWDTGSIPTSSDDVIIPDTSSINNCELSATGGNPKNVNSIKIESNGTIVGNDIEIRAYGENGSGFAVDNDRIISGDLNLTIQTAASTTCDFQGSSGNFKNVVINHASADIHLSGNTTFDGNLTITAGTFDCSNEGGSDKNLTVTGHVSVTGTLTGNASAISAGSMIINSGGTYSATTGTTTINSEDASHAFRCSGGGTFTDNNGTLLITTPAETRLKMNGTGNVHHLTVNHASCVLFMESDSSTTIEGNLTITAGTVKPHTQGNSQRTLIVTGHTEIGPASGGADQATLTCSDSPMSLGSGITNQYGLIVNQGGTFVGGSGAHTLGGLKVGNNSNAKCTLTSGVTTINGEHSSDNFNTVIYSGSTFDNADGTVTYTGMESSIYWQKNAHNIILNTSNTIIIGNALVLDNDLTITQGTLTTSGSNNALTVTGDVSVTGTLTGNASAISLGSLTIAAAGTYSATSGVTTLTGEKDYWALDVADGGTFTHNSGTVTVTTNTNTFIRGMEGDDTSGSGANALNDLTVNLGGDSYYLSLRPIGSGVTSHNIVGDVIVTRGKLYKETNAHTLTIGGDVSVSADGELGHADRTGNDTFGSLTIASGGIVVATSGTTTITSRTGGSGTYALENNGTFTHNKGTVAITDADNVVSMGLGSSLYNLTLSGGSKKIRNNTTINNNLTLTSGDLYGHSGSLTLDVLGQTILNGGTTGQNIAFSGTMNWGNVTVNSGTLKLSSGTNNAESFRNVGGTIT